MAPRRKASSGASSDANGSPHESSPSSPHQYESRHRPNARPERNPPRPFSMRLSLLPPLLLGAGLAIFVSSFFLSRTSFARRSSCEEGSAGSLLSGALGLEREEIAFLRGEGWLSDVRHAADDPRDGCWVGRRVDSMAIIVVDALRFDFARDHLPLSIGSRLFPDFHRGQQRQQLRHEKSKRPKGRSQLFQFVADPPTVTMQRLKGLTTGGLPTFADITGSFGGASIEEDSWLEQLKNVNYWDRRHFNNENVVTKGARNDILNFDAESQRSSIRPKIAFVGDDTWVDLFPTQFDDCHPYPSFNTRDLDTVDNGCLMHLPRLLDGLVGLQKSNKTTSYDDSSSSFELVVAHFLGVDHVGHTYGPNDPHMERKLHQMDVMLSTTLDAIDGASPDSCIVALVLGDHGMTEDGNHGGGTSEEVNAGLFVHFSPGCEEEDETVKGGERLDGKEVGLDSVRAFESIHQIDLVPTISLLLGLPIPYANIGGLVPALLPTPRQSRRSNIANSAIPHVATALALNAAQVWSYLHAYSMTSRDLPSDQLRNLKEILDSATMVYRDALAHSKKMIMNENNTNVEDERFFGKEENHLLHDSHHYDLHDSMAYREACGLFKLFLAESTDLGKRVWTQFNEKGMMLGIGILIVAWVMAVPLWERGVRREIEFVFFGSGGAFSAEDAGDGGREDVKEGFKDHYAVKDAENESKSIFALQPSFWMSFQSFRRVELAVAFLFMIFQCAVLTFGNSYIEHEREVVLFFLSVLCLLLFRRWYFASVAQTSMATTFPALSPMYLPLVVVLCSRMNDILVAGHGLDPSIRLHPAHHSIVFLSSLLILAVVRIKWMSSSPTAIHSHGIVSIPLPALIDVLAIVCLALSWWEKRARDHSRNGYIMARSTMALLFLGLFHSFMNIAKELKASRDHHGHVRGSKWIELTLLGLFRVMMFLVILTGPSTGSTAVLIVIQCAALCRMMESFGSKEIDAPVMAAIWRLSIRHVFFATNHHCSFNRLQYSAAFVATDTFHFHIAGSSLFLNTFGWEIIGSTLVLVLSRTCCHGGSTVRGRTNVAGRGSVWSWFRFYQLTEMLASCMSVSVMKRHLMVWAIFAPRFMFATVFTVLGLVLWFLDVMVSDVLGKCPAIKLSQGSIYVTSERDAQ